MTHEQSRYSGRNPGHHEPKKARFAGDIRLGSDEHLRLFCTELLDTHDPYRPAVIDWPALPPDVLRRVTSLPIWNMAVQKEGFASLSVASFARSVSEPLLREALDLERSRGVSAQGGLVAPGKSLRYRTRGRT